jgi:hypothetical protein
MGLDMYLNAKRFYWSKDEAPKIDDVPEGYKVSRVEVEVAYWRKANAIHNWFVENVQDGDDNCLSYRVTREQLQSLVEQCKRVIEDREKAKDLLPTENGFFFGDTEYGDYYFLSLSDTVEQIEKALQSFSGDWYFEYQSSW